MQSRYLLNLILIIIENFKDQRRKIERYERFAYEICRFIVAACRVTLKEPSKAWCMSVSIGYLTASTIVSECISNIIHVPGIFITFVNFLFSGFPSNSGTGSIVITVKDINDHSPEFEHSSIYIGHIAENLPGNSPILIVKATDKDTGANSQIMYVMCVGR